MVLVPAIYLCEIYNVICHGFEIPFKEVSRQNSEPTKRMEHIIILLHVAGWDGGWCESQQWCGLFCYLN